MANSYDEVPYATRPLYACHSDCLAVMGILLGMNPAPPARSRMLEIGCSSAGNLIPMALQYPESRFVGLDLSPVQIGLGQETVRDLEIKNLELFAQSLTDIDASWGQFDYIVCHGVYSWVPDFVRKKILEICQTNLAPQGIAYISYNTYPGWFTRKTLRDVMIYHVKRFDDPATRIAQARQLIEFLAAKGLPKDSPSAEALRRLIAELRDANDYYIYHEYLEDENRPFYFHEFMADAQAHGLQYMGNSWHHLDLDVLDGEAKNMLLNISEDLIQLEQFTDFVTNRPFRRSLLCRAEVPLDRSPPAEAIARLHVGALAEPVSPRPDCFSNEPETFVVRDKRRGTTDQPLTKTLFTTLAAAWPNTVPFETLWATIRAQLADHGCLTPELAAGGRQSLAETLIQSYLTNFASLHVGPFPFTTQPGLHPRASRLTRWQIRKGNEEFSNLRHAVVKLQGIDRIVLPILDGTRTIDDVKAALERKVEAGDISITGDNDETLTGATLRAAITNAVDEAIGRITRLSLWEA